MDIEIDLEQGEIDEDVVVDEDPIDEATEYQIYKDAQVEYEEEYQEEYQEIEEVYGLDNGQQQLLTHTYDTLPDNCKKFWNRRYQLFSLYDYGIYMTSELWYSVTPESLSVTTANIVKKLLPDAQQVLDICCGGGGNTVQLAKKFPRVGAIDIKQINVECTMNNCKVYEVEDRVWSVTGDWHKLSKSRDWIPESIRNNDKPFDFIFVSPPWGGTDYNRKQGSFDLMKMEPLGFKMLCESCHEISKNFGFFLPKSSNRGQIKAMVRKLYGKDGVGRVIEFYEQGYFKGLMVLFGEDVVKQIDYHDLGDYTIETLSDYEDQEVVNSKNQRKRQRKESLMRLMHSST